MSDFEKRLERAEQRIASAGQAASRGVALAAFAAWAKLPTVPRMAEIARDAALRLKLADWIGNGHAIPSVKTVTVPPLPADPEHGRPETFNGSLGRAGSGWIMLIVSDLGPVPQEARS
jgi:hypothetical protein